jgi:hypothetical protein
MRSLLPLWPDEDEDGPLRVVPLLLQAILIGSACRVEFNVAGSDGLLEVILFITS